MKYKEEYYSLTHPQKRIWYIDKINAGSCLHNIGGCLNINDSVDLDNLKKSINIVIKENDGLRLRLTEKEGEPVQYITDFESEDIDFFDFSVEESPREEYEEWSKSLFKKSFDLENNKLYYFAIYKISEKEYGVLLNIHHIISDGWSVSIIQKRLCEIYCELQKGKVIILEENNSYIDAIEQENEYIKSSRYEKNKKFWCEKFKEPSERFLYRTSDTLEGKREILSIDKDLLIKINDFIEDKGCSINTFFIIVLMIYINKVTYENDLTIGIPVYNRIGKKTKSTIGMFTSTMPFRFTLDSELTMEELLKKVNREMKMCLINQRYPYDVLIKDLDIGKKGYDSLFKMSVNYYNFKYASDIDGIDVDINEYYNGNQGYSLQMIVKEDKGDDVTLNFDYKVGEYSEAEIEQLKTSILNIIDGILSDNNIKIKDINILKKEEILNKLYTFNSTETIYPRKTVCDLFEEQAVKFADKVAIQFEDKVMTYKELSCKSNQFARYLQEQGVKRESIVGIMASHSIELIVAVLGTLKAGAAYVPIDPNYPKDRISYIIEDSKSEMLITDFDMVNNIKFAKNICNIKNIDLNQYSSESLKEDILLNNMAYIIYTSGSTGKPKGVQIEHGGLTNYIWWASKMYLKDIDEVMPLYSSISFDLTVTTMFAPLISGNKIVIYDTDETEFILYRILRENESTVIKLTPAHLMLLKDIDVTKSKIKRFIVGGEDLKTSLAKEIYNNFGKNVEIYNEYGPTETVVGCMIHKYDEEEDIDVSVPIGYPADNVQVYVLDKELKPVATGVPGELYISGDGVARGYLNRDELTSERFIENPFIKGKRMYKTGDMAKYLERGIIEYIGRSDNQVKLRGYRIELGEIETYLLENEKVKNAAIVFDEDSLGTIVLNAYVVSQEKVTNSELKEWLLRFLPKYMIPANFVFMDELPLTINGKIDYKSLPKPVAVKKEFIKYSTDIEEKLIEAMQEVLEMDHVSMNDNYYEIGGDSIKAIQISSKLKSKGLSIKVKDILTKETIQELADTIELCSSSNVTTNEEEYIGEINNTPITEWFFEQNFVEKNFYNQHIFLELDECLDKDKVNAAINELIKHHDSLRVNYDKEANKLFYNNNHLENQFNVRYIDLSKYAICDQKNEVKKILRESKFNIENSLLFDVVMLKMAEGKQALLFIIHHLIVDGVSWRIILNDFTKLLNELELPGKTRSLKFWSEQLYEYSKKDFREEENYWNNIISKDFNYPVDSCGDELVKTSSVLSAEMDKNIVDELFEKANEIYNLNLNEILIISLILTINKVINKDEIVIELEGHGREEINDGIDISRTVGWFTSIYPAYFEVKYEDMESNIKAIKEQLRSIPNKGFNFGILKYLKHEIKEYKNRYIRFNYLGNFDNILSNENLKIKDIEFGLDSDEENVLTALMDITVAVINKKLKINIDYSNNRFKEETIKKFLEKYMEMLNLILESCRNKESKEFTPSDFDGIDISQEDLDALFD